MGVGRSPAVTTRSITVNLNLTASGRAWLGPGGPRDGSPFETGNPAFVVPGAGSEGTHQRKPVMYLKTHEALRN